MTCFEAVIWGRASHGAVLTWFGAHVFLKNCFGRYCDSGFQTDLVDLGATPPKVLF